jgi:hypothetical protein
MARPKRKESFAAGVGRGLRRAQNEIQTPQKHQEK